jgi:hypothetical protein
MFDLGVVGSIASVVGLVAGVAVAVYQRDQALKAQQSAEAERERAVSLQDHLARQRWQQLRSLGEQIDTLELEGRQKYEVLGASLHARLREQYSGLLGVVATSTPGFCASDIRHWVAIGRLPRPWQIAEAISYLEKPASVGSQSEDERWLAAIIASAGVIPAPQPVQPPPEMGEYVASYILVADSLRQELNDVWPQGGKTDLSAAVLLGHLAWDCAQICSPTIAGSPSFRAWGWEAGKPFGERLEHYQSQDFWVLVGAAEAAQKPLNGFEELFDAGTGHLITKVIPKHKAAEVARAKYPELAQAAATVLQARKARASTKAV